MTAIETQGNAGTCGKKNSIRDQPQDRGPDVQRDISTYPKMTLQQLMASLRDLPDGTMMEVNFSDRT